MDFANDAEDLAGDGPDVADAGEEEAGEAEDFPGDADDSGADDSGADDSGAHDSGAGEVEAGGFRAEDPEAQGFDGVPGAPAGPRPATGEPRVDAALARLDELEGRPVAEHRAVFEDVHRRLRDVLGELDSRQQPQSRDATDAAARPGR